MKGKKELKLKQKIYLYYYRAKQYLNNCWFVVKIKVKNFIDSTCFYFLFFGVLIFVLHTVSTCLNLALSDDELGKISIAISGIIGASIAIIFSFSTFILQSTADLFSTQYLNKYIESTKEKLFFWLLVFLTIASFLTPIFFQWYVLEILISILLISFYLIYALYKELRKRINPETTLKKIKRGAIEQLGKINIELKKQSEIQNKIFEHKKEEKEFSLDIQYKAIGNWHLEILENVQHLFEIGLRLLAKNEINSFNLSLKFIHDIYLKHLELRNGNFIRMPASFLGAYSCDDEGFTSKILEYLQSIGNRLIQEKRKENIYFLLEIYENLLKNQINLEYADKNLNAHKGNPILNLTLAYYIRFIEKLLKANESDWMWESVKSISNVSNFVLNKTDNSLLLDQINKIISTLAIFCFSKKQESFLKEVLNIYINQIKISWNKYHHNRLLWKHIFEEMKKNIVLLSTISTYGLTVSDLFINFHSWQVATINQIIEKKKGKEQLEYLDKYISLLELWSDFLLDFARDFGLENSQTGLSIIHSIENNLSLINGIKNKFNDKDLNGVYQTQFHILSWHFHKTETIKNSFLFNFEAVLEILLTEIQSNLENDRFEYKYLIELYIELVEKHFEKATLGSGYNHPRIIVKLLYLGVFMRKYKTKHEEAVIFKIEELNKKYLDLNKDFFEEKKKNIGLMGPNEFQLCKEIHDLGNDIFSYNSSHFMDKKSFIRENISKEDWEKFVDTISYCKNVECKTKSLF